MANATLNLNANFPLGLANTILGFGGADQIVLAQVNAPTPILEAGSHLNLPKHVLSVRERVEEFARARTELEKSATDQHRS